MLEPSIEEKRRERVPSMRKCLLIPIGRTLCPRRNFITIALDEAVVKLEEFRRLLDTERCSECDRRFARQDYRDFFGIAS